VPLPLTDPRPNPPPHVARIAVSGHVDTSPWTNVFWIRNGGETTPTPADFGLVVGDFYSAYLNSLGHIGSIHRHTESVAGLYYDATGEAFGAENFAQGTGNQGEEALPANVALCISWQLSQRYRGGHPRTYIAGIAEGQQQDNVSWKTSTTQAARDFANTFHQAVNSIAHGNFSSCHLGTVSFQRHKEWRTPSLFRDFVPGAAGVDSRIDSQRRRLGRDRP